MNSPSFYNVFHKESSPQHGWIKSTNYTYSIVIGIIEKLISGKSNISILDYGCGVGTVDLYFAKKGHYIIGTDISSKAIKTAINSANNIGVSKMVNFISLKDFQNNNKKFDLILCIEVLEHISNDLIILKNLKNHLAKNGKIVISVPSKNSPLYKLGLTRKFDQKVGHLRRYDKNILEHLFNLAELDIENIIFTEGILRNSLFVFKPLGFLIKFIKGPIIGLVNFIDNKFIKYFGEADIFIVARVL